MNKIKKILILSSLPVFMLVLSACGFQTSQTPSVQPPSSQSTPSTDNSQANQPAANLEPLPANTKAAVDSEINNIDKELQTTDNALDSGDLSNSNLGL